MNLFESNDYRAYLEDHIKAQPKRGHGMKLKIAEELRVHPTLVTQVLKGRKSFSSEQAFKIAKFIGLNDLEKDYFLTLLELDRAGTSELRKFLEKKLLKLREEGAKVKNRVSVYSTLSESDQALFYSHWYYSAVRLSSGLDGNMTLQSLADRLDLPEDLVRKILDFLISRGLVVEQKNGSLTQGPQNTFLPSDSPLISRHHMNWRMKAIERHPKLSTNELAFSAPVTLSERDFSTVHKICLDFIQKVSKVVSDSPPEQLGCINIDWFRVKGID